MHICYIKIVPTINLTQKNTLYQKLDARERSVGGGFSLGAFTPVDGVRWIFRGRTLGSGGGDGRDHIRSVVFVEN